MLQSTKVMRHSIAAVCLTSCGGCSWPAIKGDASKLDLVRQHIAASGLQALIERASVDMPRKMHAGRAGFLRGMQGDYVPDSHVAWTLGVQHHGGPAHGLRQCQRCNAL